VTDAELEALKTRVADLEQIVQSLAAAIVTEERPSLQDQHDAFVQRIRERKGRR